MWQTIILGFRYDGSVVGLLPSPETKDDVITLLRPMVCRPELELEQARRMEASYIVQQVRSARTVKPNHPLYETLNQHLYLRACNQVNEVCNKLWAACELYSHLREDESNWFSREFNSGFLPTSTIPTLYYAEVSSMISLLHFFGVGSFMLGRREFWDLVRTRRGFKVQKRSEHVKALTNQSGEGWHSQVILLYAGLLNGGIGLPRVEMENVRKLKQDRMRCDYGLIAQTTMVGVFGERLFFAHLPDALFLTSEALCNLLRLRPIENACDKRFLSLLPGIPGLADRYLSYYSEEDSTIREHVRAAVSDAWNRLQAVL